MEDFTFMSWHDSAEGRGFTSNRLQMDRMYRFQRHIYDITRKYYLLGREKLIAELDVPAGGRNLLRVARTYPGARVYGIDISDEMLKSATHAIWKGGFNGRIRVAQGDAVTFDPFTTFGVRQFDRVFFSYTLSMIPDWQGALTRAACLPEPGGSLHIVDFGQCEDLPSAFRLGLFRWLQAFEVKPRAELSDRLKTIASACSADLAINSLYRGYAWQSTMKYPAYPSASPGTSSL
jgi:S-adenosylmethionine-diacylgycerolhomoserine-N-methlytransferase